MIKGQRKESGDTFGFGRIVLDAKFEDGDKYCAISSKHYTPHIYSKSYSSQTKVAVISRKQARWIIRELTEWLGGNKS